MISHDNVIIGGGAAGLICAIMASDYGNDVCIIEGMNRVGKKILTTGNGRCNITNRCIKSPYPNFHSHNEGFFKDVLDQLTVEDTIDLFNRLGIPIIELDDGKMYPRSLQASSVVDLLRLNIEERNIPVYTDSKVESIKKENQSFVIETSNAENKYIKANKVVIATGGKSAPHTGSDGSMFDMIKKLGHNVIKTKPSIVQLKLDYPHLKAISGVKFEGKVSVFVDNQKVRDDQGEVLFTDYGISGPPILQVSSSASNALEGHNVEIEVDMYPNWLLEEVITYFENQFGTFYYRSIFDNLNGVLNKKLIPIILKDAGITDIHKPCDQLTHLEKQEFYKRLKSWRFKCIDTNGFKNAQATIGGVDTKEVHSKTLESTRIPNMYFIGEVLDVDGDCGGYNLQWAWSSGYVVGINLYK